MSLVRLCSRTRNISARHLFFLFKGKLILLVKCPSLTLMRCSFNSCKTQTSRDTSKAPSQITSYASVLKHLRGRLLPKVIYFIFIQAEWLWNPLDSFVIFFVSFLGLTVPTFLSFWTYSVTNRNIALIFSVTLWTKNKVLCTVRSFQHKLHHHCFQLWCLPAFLTSLLYYDFNLSGDSNVSHFTHLNLNSTNGFHCPTRVSLLPLEQVACRIIGHKCRGIRTPAISWAIRTHKG